MVAMTWWYHHSAHGPVCPHCVKRLTCLLHGFKKEFKILKCFKHYKYAFQNVPVVPKLYLWIDKEVRW